MKLDWQFSLYDFFGFLIPGAVLLFALVMIYMGMFLPQGVLELNSLSLEEWVIFLALSYLCGHLAQGITNHLPPWNSGVKWYFTGGTNWWTRDWPTIEEDSPAIARKQLGKIIDAGWIKKLQDADVCALCEHFLVMAGRTGDREVHQYRRGFYRGFSFSSFAAALAFLFRIVTPPLAVRFTGHMHEATIWELVFLAVFFSAAGGISLNRQRRFVMYLRQLSIYGFLTSIHSSRHA